MSTNVNDRAHLVLNAQTYALLAESTLFPDRRASRFTSDRELDRDIAEANAYANLATAFMALAADMPKEEGR